MVMRNIRQTKNCPEAVTTEGIQLVFMSRKVNPKDVADEVAMSQKVPGQAKTGVVAMS